MRKANRANGTRRQRNKILIAETVAKGGSARYIYMDNGGGKEGIFRVKGSKRRPQIRMIYDLSNPTVRIPRNPWLAPAVKVTERKLPNIYRDALIFQAKRNRLFGY